MILYRMLQNSPNLVNFQEVEFRVPLPVLGYKQSHYQQDVCSFAMESSEKVFRKVLEQHREFSYKIDEYFIKLN